MHTADERKIYKYNNGVCDVAVDPLLLRRQIRLFAGEDPNKLAEDARGAHRTDATQEQFEKGHLAEEKLVSGIRQAFGLAEVDANTGEGVTWAECLLAYNAFCEWLDQKKTPLGMTPTS